VDLGIGLREIDLDVRGRDVPEVPVLVVTKYQLRSCESTNTRVLNASRRTAPPCDDACSWRSTPSGR
jgi:hypothetical protein